MCVDLEYNNNLNALNLGIDYNLDVEERLVKKYYIELPLLGFRHISFLKRESIKYTKRAGKYVLDSKDFMNKLYNIITSTSIGISNLYGNYIKKLIDFINIQLDGLQRLKDFDINSVDFIQTPFAEDIFQILLKPYAIRYLKGMDKKISVNLDNEYFIKYICETMIRCGFNIDMLGYNIDFMFDDEPELSKLWDTYKEMHKEILDTDEDILNWYLSWQRMRYNTGMNNLMHIKFLSNDFLLYIKLYDKQFYQILKDITPNISLFKIKMLQEFYNLYCNNKFKTLYNHPSWSNNVWIRDASILNANLDCSLSKMKDRLDDINERASKILNNISISSISALSDIDINNHSSESVTSILYSNIFEQTEEVLECLVKMD